MLRTVRGLLNETSFDRSPTCIYSHYILFIVTEKIIGNRCINHGPIMLSLRVQYINIDLCSCDSLSPDV